MEILFVVFGKTLALLFAPKAETKETRWKKQTLGLLFAFPSLLSIRFPPIQQKTQGFVNKFLAA